MNDNEQVPKEVFHVSTRGTPFVELGWDAAHLLRIREAAERAAGRPFRLEEWAWCQSPADIDRLIARIRTPGK